MELRERWSDEEIMDIIDDWHDNPCLDGFSLHGLLDMTWDEYKHWVETNEIPWDNFYQLRLF